MREFFEIYNKYSFIKGFKLEIYHSNIMDYCLTVFLKSDDTNPIVNIQGCDYDLLFAKGHVALKEWLIEHNEGY